MENNPKGAIFWTPRILAIIFIIFLALMSLDVFESNAGFWQTMGELFMHSVPALILLVVLIIAWKYEIVGGIVFILAGFAYIGWILTRTFQWYMLAWILQISGIAFLIGILFLVGWKRKKRTINKA